MTKNVLKYLVLDRRINLHFAVLADWLYPQRIDLICPKPAPVSSQSDLLSPLLYMFSLSLVSFHFD